MHNFICFVNICLHIVQLTCEKDEGMGLCTFNFVFRLSLHLVCLLFGTSSLHLLNFFLNFFLLTCLCKFFGCHSEIA